MANIYCGIDNVPKGKKRGTMGQCVELGQVRYYGKKKIDARTLEAAKTKKNVPETRDNLIKLLASLNGTINRNKGRYDTTKDTTAEGEKKKQEYYKLWKAAESDKVKVTRKLRKVLADQGQVKKTASKGKGKGKVKSKTRSKSKSKSKAKSKGKAKKTATKRKIASKGKSKKKNASKGKKKVVAKRAVAKRAVAKRTASKGKKKAVVKRTTSKSKSKGKGKTTRKSAKRVATKRKTASKGKAKRR